MPLRQAVFNGLTGDIVPARPSNKIRPHNLPNKFPKRLIRGFRDIMTMSPYLAPVHPGMALSNAFPSLSANAFNPYDVHQQQHPFVNELTSFDVILGKEKAIFNHSGNRRFRATINSNLDTYIAAPTKSSKSKWIRQVHADMQKSGYRFLRRNDATGICYEIEKHEAREKVSHALRDRVRERQKPTKRPRKKSTCADPPSPTSVVSINKISSGPENKEKKKRIRQREQRKKQPHQSLDIPTLYNGDLTLNQPVSREFLEVVTLYRNDKNDVAVDEHQRRLSMLSTNDDCHMRVNAKRRLSLLSINDSVSLEDMSCFKEDMLSTDSATPSKALRCNSIVGISDGFARNTKSGDHCTRMHLEPYSLDEEFELLEMDAGFVRHTSSGEHSTCTRLEPYSLDDEFELLEMDHDFSAHPGRDQDHNFSIQLGRDQEDDDVFHNMPIRDVDRSGFLAHCYRCHFKK
jgi:hypothetical protein